MNLNLNLSYKDTFINDYWQFEWDAATRSFSANKSVMSGFSGEYYDGMAEGFAIVGKSGEELWFHVVDTVRDSNGVITHWVMKGTSPRGTSLIDYGIIYNK